jgi:hypothetical protein
MESVKTDFEIDIGKNENAAGHTHCQAQEVDKGIQLLTPEIADRHFV